MTDRIAHIGLAVRNLEESISRFRILSGREPEHREVVEAQGVSTAMFDLGGTAIELLEPTRPDSPVVKFLEKRGEGMHHIAFEVADIAAELERLSAEGVELIDRVPRQGAGGCLVAFLHPRSTNGVLIELSQKMR